MLSDMIPGQISSRPHMTSGTPNGGEFSKGNGTRISGKSRLVKYYNLARYD